jgi:hypothetical protein
MTANEYNHQDTPTLNEDNVEITVKNAAQRAADLPRGTAVIVDGSIVGADPAMLVKASKSLQEDFKALGLDEDVAAYFKEALGSTSLQSLASKDNSGFVRSIAMGWTTDHQIKKIRAELDALMPRRTDEEIKQIVTTVPVAQFVSDLGGEVEAVRENLRTYAASLATNAARTTIKQNDMAQVIADLLERVDQLESEETNTVEIEPVPLADLLRNAHNRVAQLTEKEARIDEAAWKVFDNHKQLKLAGGFYDLDCLSEALPEGCEELVIEDAVATALRWCANRTRWFTNVKYWVRPIQAAGTLVIQRNRFVFQIKTPPEEAMFLDT